MRVGLLGPLQVSVDGRPVEVPAGRLPALLAVLAMSAGQTVSADRLATAVWGEDLSIDVRANVQTNVRRLRRLLGPDHIVTRGHAYALDVPPDQVDALRFVRLLDQAVAASPKERQRDLLVEALGLWRGPPFDGMRSDWLEQTQAPRLEERYLAGLERRIDLDMTGGSAVDLVAELGELTGRFPMRESLWMRLILVLQICGRPAEALERYEAVRVRLAEELGADPGPELQRVYVDLLAGRPPDLPRGALTTPVVPRQLPADTDVFAGRDAALKQLEALLDDQDGSMLHPLIVAAIVGTAGVGKTTLAIHWAYRVADRFPDGNLYVNLRGFDPSGPPTEPAEVVRRFLDALGVSPPAIPASVEAQVGMYRSLLAGRRMLLLLDNARDADQVAPLLPGAPGCLVLVTSRNQLSGLVAAGARPITLDLLSHDESVQMLAQRLGLERVAAEPDVIAEIVARCARLPLALAIVAARAVANPEFPLSTLAEQLRGARRRLDELDGGDTATDARAVFSWSYRSLDAPAARLFRLLGLHPGPDVTVQAAASIAGKPVAHVRPLLAQLVRANLLSEHTPGQYTFHDLLRAFSSELTETEDSASDRHAATQRMLDHYLHTACNADLLLFPHGERIMLTTPEPGVCTEDPGDHDQAMAWFTAEHPVLLAVIEQAARTGFHRHACQLAWAVFVFLHRKGHWQERAATQHVALDAARHLGDACAQARSHRYLGSAYADLGREDDAHIHLRHALELANDVGDPVEQAWCHYYRELLYGMHGRDAEALDSAQQALQLFQVADDRTGHAIALTDVGWYLGRLGRHRQAVELCQQALCLHEELDNRPYQAHTWSCLSEIYQQLGDQPRSIDSMRRALDLFRELGDRFGEASALAKLSELHSNAGDPDAAHDASRAAHAVLSELDPSVAEQVQIQLGSFDP